ncbi:unnamed protein product [Fraxinus pennsylvanica]|uniref:Integrase zinc-binding domain-containing protein n=1 Tax=Fraxinus pennsylvanica TaxID=56036 RepID=A0AAD2A358_9LAMI|nr:unnamed protein product [Fraxinus pennsylvanica]
MMHRRLKIQAASFTMIDRQLYKRGFTMPYLKCLRLTEAQEVLLEIHSNICGNHPRTTNFSFKAHQHGYYWPTVKDAKELGPCPWPGEAEVFLVAIDYFTKWVEAEPLATITTTKDLKTRLEKENELWANELPNVLWAYHTTPRDPTGKTHFKLAFGVEVVVLVEVLNEFDKMKANQLDVSTTHAELDLLGGMRERTVMRMMAYKWRAARYFNRKPEKLERKTTRQTMERCIPQEVLPVNKLAGNSSSMMPACKYSC